LIGWWATRIEIKRHVEVSKHLLEGFVRGFVKVVDFIDILAGGVSESIHENAFGSELRDCAL
jgi:hypothetical protein